jgi:hypothetical protein
MFSFITTLQLHYQCSKIRGQNQPPAPYEILKITSQGGSCKVYQLSLHTGKQQWQESLQIEPTIAITPRQTAKSA